jgi:hypothetical protein
LRLTVVTRHVDTIAAMRSLVVIVGAGASFDCTSGTIEVQEQLRPPLVPQLFESRPSFARILNRYPLAEAAAATIRPAVASGSTAVERFLRDKLRDSTDPYAVRRYRSVPLYLQDLLFSVSQPAMSDDPFPPGYTRQADNYDLLISAVLTLDRVIFISLNYDTLLDQRLAIYEPLDSLDWYVNTDRNWALYKLHGSVNWGRRIMNEGLPNYGGSPSPEVFSRVDAVGDVELGDITLRPQAQLNDARYEFSGDGTGSHWFFPALSIPVGEADELVCPSDHVQRLKEQLAAEEELNVLVLGYSGIDSEVLQLLREAGRPLRQLLAVNGSVDASLAAVQRLSEATGGGGGFQEPWIYDSGFTGFTHSGKLEEFITTIM